MLACISDLCVHWCTCALLVFVGSLPQLVGHHSRGEVVEVQHVLEEAVI